MSGIVVGVDRSATARAAAQKAAEVAARLGEPLHVVMAMKPGRSQVVRAGGDVFFLDWVSEAREFLRELVSELEAPDATFAVGGKDPARSLCDEAGRLGASLIIVGNRRTQGAARALGSIATDVLRQAPCDVMVAHTSGGDTAAVPAALGVSSAKIFERCTRKQRRAIDALATPAAVSAGEMLTQQGEVGREFGVLLDGTATVSIDGRPVATLAAGDHFGEVPLLETAGGSERLRSATVTADVDLWASMMSVVEFDQLVSRFPDIADELRNEVVERSGAH